MIGKSLEPRRGCAVLLLTLGLAAPAPAAAAPPLAELELAPAQLRLRVAEPGRGWLLTLSGPDGEVERHEFRGRAPELSLVGPQGALPADGSYTWELRTLSGEGGAQNGHFLVRGGAVVLSEEPEPAPAAAAGGPLPAVPTVFTDDVIIQAKLCVGDGCSAAESIPLVTQKLKANNTWIEFDDTSSTSFPDTHWQLRVNDASGIDGIERFTIEDLTAGRKPFTILAGAANNSIWVDSAGRVGLGTATPTAKLHVIGNATVSGDLTVLSSREAKRDFQPVDGGELLASLDRLPLNQWSYRADPQARHLGPTAEEFRDAFALGSDPRAVSPNDLAGVALAAVQELNRRAAGRAEALERRLEQSTAEIAALRQDRDELARRLSQLEQLLAAPAPAEPRMPFGSETP